MEFRGWVFPLLLILFTAGCSKLDPGKVRLNYKVSSKPTGVHYGGRVGVFVFADERKDIALDAFGTIVRKFSTWLPLAYYSDVGSKTPVGEYVTDAFKTELESLGFQVVDGGIYSESFSFRALTEHALKGADRVVGGRVRFFRWVEAGFAGLIFQAAMPKPRVNIEVHAMVVDPGSKKILWAGSGGVSEKCHVNMPMNDEREDRIMLGTSRALENIVGNAEFLRALSLFSKTF